MNNEELQALLMKYGEKAPILMVRNGNTYEIEKVEIIRDGDGIPLYLAIVCGEEE